MSVGTGIFLSALIGSMVWLYLATRGRWNWKKIIIRITAVVFGLGFIGGATGGVYYYISQQPEVQSEYYGINLGDSYRDVVFKNGLPKEMRKGDSTCRCDSTIFDEDRDSILDHSRLLLIRFRKDTVVGVYTRWYGSPYVNEIQGIGRYSSMEDVRKKFGQPDEVKESDDGTVRRWFYSKYRVRFGFEKGQINSLGTWDPRY
jgi:hypothetical protein